MTSAARCSASRVLPAPPGPVSVMSRARRSRRRSSASCGSRPTKELSSAGRLFGVVTWGRRRLSAPYRVPIDSGPTIETVPTPSSDDAFAEVKAKVDLVKIVQEHVRMTKRNKDFWGLCPFHQEDSPSFKVNAQMQSWYCFGCERHGDVFTFVELIEKTDKRGALQLLAERAGVELKKLSPEQKERSDSR